MTPDMHARVAPLASVVVCELIYGTPTVDIAQVCGAATVDHLVGFLSRAEYNDVATDLWLTAKRERTA